MGYSRISQFIVWAEDISVLFIIFKLSKSFQYIYKYGITHFKGNSTALKINRLNQKYLVIFSF